MVENDGEKRQHYPLALYGIVLTVWVIALYGSLSHFDFVYYDDSSYVSENSIVRAGLTGEGLRWAFLDTHTGYWHPLTWVSHMLDCDLYGDWPGGHHLTNVLLHGINTLLLFILLSNATSQITYSAFAAALFAVHPLNVESVAWVAERKNVLSGFFFFSSLLLYVFYVRKRRPWLYGGVFVLFVAGLLAKPITVTVPILMLLMDYWPLQRWTIGTPPTKITGDGGLLRRMRSPLILEKVPFFVLSAALGMATLYAAYREHNLVPFDTFAPSLRLTTALVSYGRYLWQLIWPAGLAVFYPQPSEQPLTALLTAAMFLTLVTAVCLRQRKRRPYLLMGWLWYLVVLFPVIGIIQTGYQAIADRYAYHAFPGLFIMISWGLPELMRKVHLKPKAMAGAALAAIVCLSVVTAAQVRYWQDSVKLFQRAVDVTTGNWLAHNNLGVALMKRGGYEEALHHFQEVLKLSKVEGSSGGPSPSGGSGGEGGGLKPNVYPPNLFEAYNNAAVALCFLGRYEEAKIYVDKALQLRPEWPSAHNNLGYILALMGRHEEAIVYFHKAIAGRPDYVDALHNLASALAETGRLDEAIDRFYEVLKLSPGDASVHFHLGLTLAQKGHYGAAWNRFQAALAIKPDYREALVNMRRVEEMMRQGGKGGR